MLQYQLNLFVKIYSSLDFSKEDKSITTTNITFSGKKSD